jgi:hypothetical protein
VVSVQVWRLWVMTFMFSLHSNYMSIIAASSYCLILYLLLWFLVVGHNLLACHWSFVVHISVSCFTFVLTMCLFLHDFYLTIHSGGDSHHHHHHYCCYICKVLSSDSMEQNVEVNKLLKFWLICSLAFLQS